MNEFPIDQASVFSPTCMNQWDKNGHTSDVVLALLWIVIREFKRLNSPADIPAWDESMKSHWSINGEPADPGDAAKAFSKAASHLMERSSILPGLDSSKCVQNWGEFAAFAHWAAMQGTTKIDALSKSLKAGSPIPYTVDAAIRDDLAYATEWAKPGQPGVKDQTPPATGSWTPWIIGALAVAGVGTAAVLYSKRKSPWAGHPATANPSGGKKIGVSKIQLRFAEGPSHMSGTVVDIVAAPGTDVWKSSNKVLMDWAMYIKKGMAGFLKQDFIITWKDGETYKGRYDLVEDDKLRANLSKHVVENVTFLAGLRRPGHMTEEQYDQYVDRSGMKKDALEFLSKYELGPSAVSYTSHPSVTASQNPTDFSPSRWPYKATVKGMSTKWRSYTQYFQSESDARDFIKEMRERHGAKSGELHDRRTNTLVAMV
jgi:hypothetical protein